MIDGKKNYYQPVKNDLRKNDNIEKIAAGQEHDYTAVCLLDYPYFKKHYKMIAIYLSKQPAQEINFTESLEKDGNIIIEEAKETVFRFFTGES